MRSLRVALAIISAAGLAFSIAGAAAVWVIVLNAVCFGYWAGHLVGES